MAARDLVSKLLAAGLSAGVFLIWWPEHHPTTDLVSLVVRGALWTLAFELLLLAFAPLERQVRRAIRERVTFRRRLEVRIGGACVLACAGAALPVMLLAGAHAPGPARAASRTPKPQRVVVVKRQKVVVKREVVTVPSAAVEHPAPVSPVVVVKKMPAAKPAAKPAKRATTRATAPEKKKTTNAASPTTTAPVTPPASTTPAPAAADAATP